MKWGLKGGILIYADSGPPRYVLWCSSCICHEVLTFIQICCGHTMVFKISFFHQLVWRKELHWDTKLFRKNCDFTIKPTPRNLKWEERRIWKVKNWELKLTWIKIKVIYSGLLTSGRVKHIRDWRVSLTSALLHPILIHF